MFHCESCAVLFNVVRCTSPKCPNYDAVLAQAEVKGVCSVTTQVRALHKLYKQFTPPHTFLRTSFVDKRVGRPFNRLLGQFFVRTRSAQCGKPLAASALFDCNLSRDHAVHTGNIHAHLSGQNDMSPHVYIKPDELLDDTNDAEEL